VAALAADLEAGHTTSRELIEQALARIADPAGEGKRAFVKAYDAAARAATEAQDKLRAAGYVASPLAGIPVSIKDLFDVAGEVTLAGSKALDDAPPAKADAPIVARLKRAGAVIIGRTNMTEFAFSGVGINPHYGTPGNPFDRTLIPGGSSAGAPISVADGMAAVAIGTDTGGSVRIPAALCGLVGFKPTQYRVPRDGTTPLSISLDSVGPIGVSVACCALIDAVMAGEEPVLPKAVPPEGLRLGIPQTVMLDDLETPVATAFERSVSALSRAGARIVELPLEMLGDYARINIKGGLPVVEAFAWHEKLLARRGRDYDPRIRTRIERGREMTAADYVRLVEARTDFIGRFDGETEGFDALVMPTVPITAPPIAAFARDVDYARLNLKLLQHRNREFPRPLRAEFAGPAAGQRTGRSDGCRPPRRRPPPPRHRHRH
jgi:aspartyl-tRNA(Asn)/glutamyl-tRNA(Gln) amidotransferase subunit A